MSAPCQSDLLPCGARSGVGTTDVLASIWGDTNPYDPVYLQALADTVVCTSTTCYAWRQRWVWDCTAIPHAWRTDGSAETVVVPCDQTPGLVESIDGCSVWVYGTPVLFVDLPETEDTPDAPTFPSVDDTTCCPPSGVQECQWYCRFRYDEGTCTWVVQDAPTIIDHATGREAGSYCAPGTGSEAGSLFISKYGPVIDSAEGQTCSETYTVAPEGFDTPPIDSVYYVACLATYSGYDCSDDAVTAREIVIIAIAAGTACPDTVSEGGWAFGWPLEPGGQCVNMTPDGNSEKLTLLTGPFCSYSDASDWAAANASMCPAL